jgi:thiol-disulfide isomerase/thioredoxin
VRTATIVAAAGALAAACSSQPPSQGMPPAPVRLDPPAAPGSLGGFVAADGDALMATWLEPVAADGAAAGSTRRGPHRVRFARLGGGAWSEPVTIAEGDRVLANWADFPSVARGGDGALVAHWAQRAAPGSHDYDVALARSADGGATWTPLGLAHDDGVAAEHGFVSMVPDRAGVRAFWLDGREMAGGDHGHGGHGAGAMTLRTALIGEAVTAGEIVDARVCDCCGTAAAATGAGAVVVYRDRSADEVRDIAIARRGEAGWSEPAPVFADGWRVPGCPVNGPALAADGARLVVAWYTYAGDRGRVRAAFSDDAGERFDPPIEVDGPRGRTTPIGRVDVELVARDEAVVTWMVSDREEATVLARRVARAGRVGDARPVIRTAASRDAGFPRIARRGDALGLLWTEAGERGGVRFQSLPLASLAPATALPAPEPAGGGGDEGNALLALGSRAPEYDAVALDGARVALADTRGSVTLVNLWATWCEPCRHELPVLAALQRAHGAAGLRVIAVSVDRDRTADELRAFFGARELPFEVWHDPGDRASKLLGVGPLPASFVFDRAGALVWRRSGAIPEGDPGLEQALVTALSAK